MAVHRWTSMTSFGPFAGRWRKSTTCERTRWCCFGPEAIPRTPSGKVQRRVCKASFLNGTLDKL